MRAKIFKMKFKVLPVFFSYRGTNSCFVVLKSKRYLVKSLQSLAKLIIVFKVCKAWKLPTIFQKLPMSSQEKKDGRIWLAQNNFLHLWCYLFLGYVMRKPPDHCTGKEVTLHFTKIPPLEKGSISYYRCPSPLLHWANLVHRRKTSLVTRESFLLAKAFRSKTELQKKRTWVQALKKKYFSCCWKPHFKGASIHISEGSKYFLFGVLFLFVFCLGGEGVCLFVWIINK